MRKYVSIALMLLLSVAFMMPLTSAGQNYKPVVVATSEWTLECVTDIVAEKGLPILLASPFKVPESTVYFLEDYHPTIIYVVGPAYGVISALQKFAPVEKKTVIDLMSVKGMGLNFEIPGYYVVADNRDPFYAAAKLLAAYHNAPILGMPPEFEELVQTSWKMFEWELVAGMWGWWQYYVYNAENYDMGNTYIMLTDDAIFTAYDNVAPVREAAKQWFAEINVDPNYIAIVGDIGTSMEFYRNGLARNKILAPELVWTYIPCDYLTFVTSGQLRKLLCLYHDVVIDHNEFYSAAPPPGTTDAYTVYTNVQFFAPFDPINATIWSDGLPWISSLEEHEMLKALALENCRWMPSPETPLSLDVALTYDYPTGRITGFDLADTVALIARNIFYDQVIDPEYAGNFADHGLVPVEPYAHWNEYSTENLMKNAGFSYYGLNCSECMYYDEIEALETQKPGQWYWTHHGNFAWYVPNRATTGYPSLTEARLLFLGDGVSTHDYFGYSEYYDIAVSGGESGKEFHFINTDLLFSVDYVDYEYDYPSWLVRFDSRFKDPEANFGILKFPRLYNTVTFVMTCMAGSSKAPLMYAHQGAASVLMGTASQEVFGGEELVALFYDALAAGKSVGEALNFASENYHLIRWFYHPDWYYFPEEGDYHENSMYVIGDPALHPYVPNPQPLVPPEVVSDPFETGEAGPGKINHRALMEYMP